MRIERAISLLGQPHTEPLFGQLSIEHVQLVPQTFGTLTDEVVDAMRYLFPETQFRLHANARVVPRHCTADLSSYGVHGEWFSRAASVSRLLRAPAYSAHSGSREHCDLKGMLENARRCAELFECPVAVEGQYPNKENSLLVSTWYEYRALFESGVPYALDLSHLNILAVKTGERDDGLLRDMLACERCLEVHVSDNDGSGDWHQVCCDPPWWYPHLQSVNSSAVIFSEGNHLRKMNT